MCCVLSEENDLVSRHRKALVLIRVPIVGKLQMMAVCLRLLEAGVFGPCVQAAMMGNEWASIQLPPPNINSSTAQTQYVFPHPRDR